jgi:hypothetical protein
MTHLGPATGASLCPSLPEVPFVSKMMMSCLASFLGVSPFRETQDPMVDARLDLTPVPSRSWMKSTTKPARPCVKYVVCKMLAWYTKYPPKNDRAAAAVEASTPPPRNPDRPTAAANEPRPNVAWPSPMMRAKPTINGHCRLADLDQGRGKWEGGFLARSILCNTLQCYISCYITSYTTSYRTYLRNMLFHIFLLYHTLCWGVT